jgi:hypothetical protein
MTACVLACLATALTALLLGVRIGYTLGRDEILAKWRKSDHDAVFPP